MPRNFGYRVIAGCFSANFSLDFPRRLGSGLIGQHDDPNTMESVTLLWSFLSSFHNDVAWFQGQEKATVAGAVTCSHDQQEFQRAVRNMCSPSLILTPRPLSCFRITMSDENEADNISGSGHLEAAGKIITLTVVFYTPYRAVRTLRGSR
jgi:hypothetical protein